MPIFVLGSEKIVVSVSVGICRWRCSRWLFRPVVSVDWASIFCAVSVGMFLPSGSSELSTSVGLCFVSEFSVIWVLCPFRFLRFPSLPALSFVAKCVFCSLLDNCGFCSCLAPVGAVFFVWAPSCQSWLVVKCFLGLFKVSAADVFSFGSSAESTSVGF